MINFKALGQRIRDERKKRNLTQEKFSEILDITPQHLSRIESGFRPSLVLIEKISSVLEVDEAEIMFGAKSDEEEVKDLMNKICSMDAKKRHAVERMIDIISEL